MNCNCSNKASTAYLYRNGILIEQATANFTVCSEENMYQNIDLTMGYNRCRNSINVCMFIKNCNQTILDNALVRVRVCCRNNSNNLCNNGCLNNNCRFREFNLCNMCPGMNRQICFSLNRCCCRCYDIYGEIIVDGQVVAQENLSV